jgi:uncharacterized protein YbjT (DUF2867 family)
MRVLLTGATGFIGSAVLARLVQSGCDVVAVAHRASAPRPQPSEGVRWVVVDLSSAAAENWIPHLVGVDVVVNCVGVLQDSPWDSTAVHSTGASALFAAAEAAGVDRVIHFSAIGVDRETPTAFSATKYSGDLDLMQRKLRWVILRPSVVIGHRAYGGSALIRGLAALPVLPRIDQQAPIQVVILDDVIRTVQCLSQPDAPSGVALDLAGPEQLALLDVVRRFRRWLGWTPARMMTVPSLLMQALYKLGDFAGWLGWRPAIRSTAKREIVRGAVGDNHLWRTLTGIEPRSLDDLLGEEPAGVQDRWFARLYFLKPIIFAVYSSFWIGTGLISLGPGYGIGVSLMQEGGAGVLAGPSVIAGGIADIIVGAGIAFRRTAKLALLIAIALTLFYVVTGTLLLPRLWEDPLGPMWKIWPVLVLNFIALAILEER